MLYNRRARHHMIAWRGIATVCFCWLWRGIQPALEASCGVGHPHHWRLSRPTSQQAGGDKPECGCASPWTTWTPRGLPDGHISPGCEGRSRAERSATPTPERERESAGYQDIMKMNRSGRSSMARGPERAHVSSCLGVKQALLRCLALGEDIRLNGESFTYIAC